MSHELSLIPNYTLFYQVGIFLASFIVLKVLVFKPYLALLHAREERTTGLNAKAALSREKAEKLKSDYEAFMKAERKKVASWADDERKKISDEEKAVIQQARGEVGKELQDLRGKITQDTEQVSRELTPLVAEYSSKIASKLVGYPVTIPAKSIESVKGAE